MPVLEAQSETVGSGMVESCCQVCGCQRAVAVAPRISSHIADFLSNQVQLFNLLNCFGSPLNIVFPDFVEPNLARFSHELSKRLVPGRILCTTKPNKAGSILSCLATSRAWIDVSSLGSLQNALSHGISGSRIQATGPKDPDYLALALAHHCHITIDNPAEFRLLESIGLAFPQTQRAKILLRIRGNRRSFRSSTSRESTFGNGPDEISFLLAQLKNPKSSLELAGFHFHLHGATTEERRDTFQVAFNALREARSLGFRPRIINVGGGYKVRYAESSEEWEKFQSYLRASVRGEVTPTTWQQSGLGYWLDSRGVSGAPSFIDHAPKVYAEHELGELLESRCPALDNQSVASIMADSLLELWVEPGRAAFDQCGITLGRVTHTHQISGRRPRIYVEMNQSNIRSSQQKLLTQPLFIPNGPREASLEGMFLLGNLCVAEDILQHNAVFPGFLPQLGDIVVFVNTAAYLMDFIESPMLLQRVAQKVAAWKRHENWHNACDREFSAIRRSLQDSRL
jgi:diaminopimelate decarboxylase